MSNLIIKETVYKSFGNCIEINNGIVKLFVTIDYGPRIINYSFMDGENIMYEDAELSFREPASEKEFGSPWYLYGGHRIWTSPENFSRCYYPDNSPVTYEFLNNGARFIQRYHDVDNMQCEFTVTMDENTSDVTVSHKLTNCGEAPLTVAIWGVSSLSSGGMEIVPLPQTNTHFTPNKRLAFWSHTNIGDTRAVWGEKYLALFQKDINKNFKVGINTEENYAIYVNNGDIFVKKYDLVKDGVYPDGGMPFETYTNKNFLEMESLGELKTLKKGEFSTHSEYWSLYNCEVDKAIDYDMFDRIVNEYVKLKYKK